MKTYKGNGQGASDFLWLGLNGPGYVGVMYFPVSWPSVFLVCDGGTECFDFHFNNNNIDIYFLPDVMIVIFHSNCCFLCYSCAPY